MDLKALLNNKKVLAGGVGVAAAAGLGVWYYRKSHGTASGSSATSTTDATDAGAVPSGSAAGQFPDTSGTDVANWLGSQEGAFQSEFSDFLEQAQSQNEDFLAGLGTAITPPATTPVATSPIVIKAPPVTPAKPAVPTTPVKTVTPPKPVAAAKPYVTVAKYTTANPPWNSTLSGIAAHEKTTVAALEKLNGNVDPKKLQIGQKIYY